MKKLLKSFKKTIKNFPAVKGHLDAFVALITILLSAVLLYSNVRNLHNSQTTPSNTPQPSSSKVIIVTPVGNGVKTPTGQVTLPPDQCTKGIGQISIDSPNEGETVNDNPLCIGISYNQGNYCSAVWSYKLNNNNWSAYGNESPCFYNISSGNMTFSMRVKSLIGNDTKTLQRNFAYQSTSSSSATLQ